MTPLMFAGCMTCLLFGSVRKFAYLAASKTSFFHFESALVGQDLTLKCFYQDRDGAIFYWYKMTQGQKPQLMSEFYKHRSNGSLQGNFRNNPRFDLETGSGKNHLKISNIQMSDSATYYCASIFSYVYEFLEGFIVDVKGSGLTIQALVHQSASETVHPGGSVTLNCTVQTGSCDGEHSVYWFRNSEDSHPGLIYSHGGRNDQCERKPNTQTHTCVSNLSIQNWNVSHAGTYYCAVVVCGHIVFGDGTKLDLNNDADPWFVVFLLSGTLVFTSILSISLIFSVCMMNKAKSSKSSGRWVIFLTYHLNKSFSIYMDFRSGIQRDPTWTKCVYYTVKQ
uniref:Ig-like domain-containing protein n=1 Tax=Kryptolebias marmoratus TaxID=37003 RepID=A0A3Q3GG19_KRYMA